MRFPRRSLLLLLALTGISAASGADLLLPPVAGEISGKFQPLQLPGAPELTWKLVLASPGEGSRSGELVAEGAGTRLRVRLELDASGNGTWRLVEGRVELKAWLNGQLTAGSTELAGQGTLRDGRIDGEVTAQLHDVDLGELARFADNEKAYVRAAEGRVEGRVGVRIRNGAVSAGESRLMLPAGTVGTVYFVPSPGLLTSYVPAQVRKLYPGIEAIEMGVTPLEAKVLRLTFHPDGDEAGRGARLRIEGRPRDPKLVAPLELDVNFTGPLESLVRKALDSRLKIGSGK